MFVENVCFLERTVGRNAQDHPYSHSLSSPKSATDSIEIRKPALDQNHLWLRSVCPPDDAVLNPQPHPHNQKEVQVLPSILCVAYSRATVAIVINLTEDISGKFNMRKRTTLKVLSIFCLASALAHGFGGGQHIANAGQGLQSAAMAQGDVRRAGPQLLKTAGESLVDIAEGWSQKNWEIVSYAAEDCSQCLHALSQIQSSSDLQRIYRTASGELHEVSLTSDGTGLTPNWERLAECLQEAAHSQLENEDPSWAMSLLSASKSIQALVEESQ